MYDQHVFAKFRSVVFTLGPCYRDFDLYPYVVVSEFRGALWDPFESPPSTTKTPIEASRMEHEAEIQDV